MYLLTTFKPITKIGSGAPSGNYAFSPRAINPIIGSTLTLTSKLLASEQIECISVHFEVLVIINIIKRLKIEAGCDCINIIRVRTGNWVKNNRNLLKKI